MLKKYRFSFDISGLVIFLIVMIPNFIWFGVPAPNDILRKESVTAVVDRIGSISQVLFSVSSTISKFQVRVSEQQNP